MAGCHCTFACWVKSDFRTLYSGISFSMWSNGCQRPMLFSMCCLVLQGFVSTFAFSVNAFSIVIGFWTVHNFIKIGYKLNLEML